MKRKREQQQEEIPEEQTGAEDAEGEEYLSKLANSVLKRQQLPYKQRVAGPNRDVVKPGEDPRVKTTQTPAPTRHEAPDPSSAAASAMNTPLPVGQKRLRDSGNTPPPAGASSRAGTPPPAPRRRTPQPAPRSESRAAMHAGIDGTFAVGTILHFEDGNIGVYKDARTDKDYEVVNMLHLDGTVEPRGIALENYDIKVIGQLPPELSMRLNRRKEWERDAIIYYLDAFDYCSLVPHPDPSQKTVVEEDESREAVELPSRGGPSRARAEEESLSPSERNDPKNLSRGRRFSINFGGGKEWFAVYWGEDELGTVVAHNTHDRWSLMHLDLKRFQDSLVIGDRLSNEELHKIVEDVAS